MAREKIVWHATIDDVREKSLTVGGKKSADGKAELQIESAGWWIYIGQLSLYAGKDKPPFEKGETIRLVLEKQENSSDASKETEN